jgi:hypothetical protein
MDCRWYQKTVYGLEVHYFEELCHLHDVPKASPTIMKPMSKAKNITTVESFDKIYSNKLKLNQIFTCGGGNLWF